MRIGEGDATLSADGGPRDEDSDLAVGDVLADRYELREELGRGAHGVVFRAHDRVAGTEVAIKSLGALRRSHIAPERLRRELRAAWNVTHPGVVRIHDVIVDGDQVALSMQLLSGETLSARLARGKLSLDEVARLARELASALAAAHDAGVVHRDLKPSNIIIVEGGRAVITDFGLSRIPGMTDDGAGGGATIGTNGELTRSGELVGTPAFMAPEQLRGETAIGPAADVYAFGLVMFEAATGVRAQVSSELRDLMRERLERPPSPVATHRRDLPRRLARVIDDSLAIDAKERIPDGHALVARLTVRSRRAWLAAALAVVALAAGAFAWERTHRAPGIPGLTVEHPATGPLQLVALVPGGSGAAIVQRALHLSNGDLLLAGHATGGFAIGRETAGGTGPHFGYLVALAPDGSVRWHRELVADHDVQVVDAIETNGLVIVAGAAHNKVDLGNGVTIPGPPHLDFSDGYIAAFDVRDGTARWAAPVGASLLGHARALAADAAGNVYTIGDFAGEAAFGKAPESLRGVFIASYRIADGTQRWVTATRDVVGTNRGFAVAVRGNDLYAAGMIAGHTRLGGVAVDADRSGDGFLAVLDASSGVVRRAMLVGGPGNSTVSSLALDADGKIALAGAFSDTLELPGHRLTSHGSEDAFVAMLAPDLTPLWAVSGGGSNYDSARSVALGPRGVFAVGKFDLDFEFGAYKLTAAGGSDMFLVELAREDGAVRSLLRIGSIDSERARTVSVERDGAIGLTGTFRRTLDVAGAKVVGPGPMNGFAIELRP